jgi:hypothetical protein
MSTNDREFGSTEQLMTADLAVAATDAHELGCGERSIIMDLVVEGDDYHGSGGSSCW